MEQGTNHMLEVPVEKAAVSRRFLKWISCSWFCPHDELPFAVSWFQDIYKGGPIGKWYRPFARRTVGRGKGVRASRIVSSQELLPIASTVWCHRSEQGETGSRITAIFWEFAHSDLRLSTMARPFTFLQSTAGFSYTWSLWKGESSYTRWMLLQIHILPEICLKLVSR